MRRLLSRIAFVISLAVAVPAVAAEQRAGHREALQDVADCVIAKKPNEAINLLKTYQRSDGEYALVKTLIELRKECPSSFDFQFSVAAFRGAIAQTLYRQRFAAAPLAQEIAPVMPAEADWASRKELAAINRLAACTTSRNVAGVDALVRVAADSDAEAAAIAALQPDLNECGKQIGNLAVTTESLRAVLAESLYRLALAGANEPLPPRPWPPVARN